jgi:hypothetical protein
VVWYDFIGTYKLSILMAHIYYRNHILQEIERKKNTKNFLIYRMNILCDSQINKQILKI